MAVFVLALLMLVSGNVFGFESCEELRSPFMTKVDTEKVFAAQVLKAHQKGTEVPALDHEGPGYCYGAEKGITSHEVTAFEYERLGLGRGEAYDSYLVKHGGKHALFIGAAHMPKTNAQCLFTFKNDREITLAQLNSASENSYDSTRGVYTFSPPNSAYPAQEREIRSVNDGKDLTLHFVKDLNKHYIVCIFPRH